MRSLAPPLESFLYSYFLLLLSLILLLNEEQRQTNEYEVFLKMMMKSAVLVSLALLGAILATQPVDGNIFEQRLQTDLMRGYNRLVRPVEKNHDQLVIQFGIKLIQILDVVGDQSLESRFLFSFHF